MRFLMNIKVRSVGRARWFIQISLRALAQLSANENARIARKMSAVLFDIVLLLNNAIFIISRAMEIQWPRE